jgi:hypothetical protein
MKLDPQESEYSMLVINNFIRRWMTITLVICSCLLFADWAAAEPLWVSPNSYRIMLMVNPQGVIRSHSPASVDIDLVQALADQGGSGTFDEHTIEVVAYDSLDQPVIYDPTRPDHEKYLLPWRIEKYYGIDTVTLSFVMPSHTYTQYAVYFDNVASGRGQPQRFGGLVGNGDWFRQVYGRREIGRSKFGDMADLDGDGDLDLFEAGVEPFVYCWENVGGGRLVERGKLTSGGGVFIFPRNAGSNRAWMTITLYDWDGDGGIDLFPSFTDGPDLGDIVFYRNITTPGGQLTFSRVGPMLTQSGASVGGGGWFPTPTFVVDWDGVGDGLTDILVARSEWDGGHLYLHRNLGAGVLANGVRIQADGNDITLTTPQFECIDIDGDTDLDLLATAHDWGLTRVYWYKNTGTRQNPVFAAAVELASMVQAYPGLKVADFDGDDLLDISVGTFWKQVENDEPQSFGGLLKNMGPQTNPTFELRLADTGSLYTEQFQICDAGQQNGVRSLDWDGDGHNDLVASSSGGLLRYFRNLTNNQFPVFAPPQTLMVGGPTPYPIEMAPGPESGYARHDNVDWNNDGFIDLIVGDEDAQVFIFLNDGLGNDPATFQPGYHLQANNKPLDCLKRGSPLVCDWNNDGKKDLVFGMTPKQEDLETPYDWPDQGDGDKTDDEGFLFYENVGSDADPVLAYPSWIRADGQIITYTRPNLGNFVDWDGDGKKDFITCHFEGNIRFYKNIGSGAPNIEPQLWPADGTILIEPYVKTQMISGADVLDWRGDGDLDIITGQGHSGSGLRYYERDYINDFVNNTYPTVIIATPDTVPPGNVQSLQAYRQSETSVLINWTNPNDADFVGTMIRYRTDAYPTSVSDGTLLCDRNAAPGSNDSFTHDQVQGQVIYYTAFTHDLSGNYSSGTNAVSSNVWMDESFDEYSDGNLDGQGGWTRTPVKNPCVVQQQFRTGTSGKAVEMFGTTTVYDDATFENFVNITSGYHIISFDMLRNATATANQAIVDIFGSNFRVTRVYWSGGYKILTGPGNTFIELVTDPISGQWYHIKIGIDLDNLTVDAWADGVQKVVNQPFHQSATNIDNINLTGYGYEGTTTPSYIDNLKGMILITIVPADFNGDGYVDAADFNHFQECSTGPNIPQTDPQCQNADLDDDQDVDQEDFGLFQRCYSGQNNPADQNCAD